MRVWIRLAVIGSAIAAMACAGDLTAPPIMCSNPLIPPDGFRVVRALTSGLDTSARLVNHYLEPHRSDDSVQAHYADGTPAPGYYLVFRGPPNYCLTFADSLVHHDLSAVLLLPEP